jgi:DKNYY family
MWRTSSAAPGQLTAPPLPKESDRKFKMSEAVSVAAQIRLSEDALTRWFKHSIAPGKKVLDALADMLNQADLNPQETLYICQYLPAIQTLVFFLSNRNSSRSETAPILSLLELLTQYKDIADDGYLAIGTYPFGGFTEYSASIVRSHAVIPVEIPHPHALDELEPIVVKLLKWMPEQYRHLPSLYHRKIVLRFRRMGNSFVRRATPDQPILIGDDYFTDGKFVLDDRNSEDGVPVPQADPYTFRRVAGRLWADSAHLYCDGQLIAKLEGKPKTVGDVVLVGRRGFFAPLDSSGLAHDEVDPTTLRRIDSSGDYYEDAKHVWHGMTRLPECPGDLTILFAPGSIAKGRNAVYRFDTPMKDAAPEQFEFLGKGYFRDNGALWHYDSNLARLSCMPSPAAHALQLVGPFCTDGFSVWWEAQVLAGADPATFRAIGSSYAIDSQQAWFQANQVDGADLGSFQNLEGSVYAQDRKCVYAYGEVILNAQPNTLRILSWCEAEDDQQIYVYGRASDK